MDRPISKTNDRGKVTLDGRLLGRNHGKTSMGFTGFKIVNSNVKVMKPVEVKSSIIRSKHDSISPRKLKIPSSVVSVQNEKLANPGLIENESPTKQCTTDALKEMRERVQAKRRNHGLSPQISPIKNGIHLDASVPSTDAISKKKLTASLNSHVESETLQHISVIKSQRVDSKHCSPEMSYTENSYDRNHTDASPRSNDRESGLSAKHFEAHKGKESQKSSRSNGSNEDNKSTNQSKRHDERNNKSHRRARHDSGDGDSHEKKADVSRDHSSNRGKRSVHSRLGRKRDSEKDNSHSKPDHHSNRSSQKHSDSRKNNDRKNSPHRERRHNDKDKYESSKKITSRDKSRSPHRDKDRDVYYCRSHAADWDSSYRSKEYSESHSREKKKQKTSARKYSLHANSRDSKSQSSHTCSRRSDARNKHDRADSLHDRGHSPRSQRRSAEHSSATQHSSKTSSKRVGDEGRNQNDVSRKTENSRSENARKTTVSSSDDKKKRTKIDGGLFSKLSIAFSLEGEDEDYEVEMSGSEEEMSTAEMDRNKSQSENATNAVKSLPGHAPLPNCDTNDVNTDDSFNATERNEESKCDSGNDSADTVSAMMVVDQCGITDDRNDFDSADSVSHDEDSAERHACNDNNQDDTGYTFKTDLDTVAESCNHHDSDIVDYNISIPSPPTPLMDEPQDDTLYVSRCTDGNYTTHNTTSVTCLVSESSNASTSRVDYTTQKVTTDACSLYEPSEVGISRADTVSVKSSPPQVLPECTVPTSDAKSLATNTVLLDTDSGQNALPELSDCGGNSDSNPVKSTPTVSDMDTKFACDAPPGNFSQSSNLTFSGAHKIPSITSRLQNVYQSLLETSFESDEHEIAGAADESAVKRVPRPNGAVLKRCGEPDNKSSSSDMPDFTTTDSKDTGNGEDSTEFKTADNGPDFCDLTADSMTDNELDEPSTVNLPHKLKLHATTKTPLPAKKSYVQQVHPQPETQKEGSSPPVASIPTGVQSSSKRQSDVTESSSLKSAHDSPNGHCATNSESVGLRPDETGLSRQDSGSSGGNDNEEGPRRSARIRTKKTERSIIKKRTSVAEKQQVQLEDPASSTVVKSEPIQLSSVAVSDTSCNIPQCAMKDLTEEEIFKLKIRLAPGIPDCPDRFDLLEENLYLTSIKKSRARKEIKRMVCDCGLDDGTDCGAPCAENCLNRLLMIECSSRCHYGSKCTNTRFQTRNYAPTEVFKTHYKGWGIRAAADIVPGELVMEYCGEVVDQREFTRRSLEYSKSNHAHFYFMALSQDEVIDATYKGNASRFINHSCEPNAETQKWTVNGRLRVGFFTVKPIKNGDEITFDYQFERYGKIAQKCFCGAAKCRGYLGKAPDENEEDESKYSRLLSTETFAESEDSPEKTQKKKKISLFRDDTMEKDISKLKSGLQSTKDVLTLSRLMVRCDTHAQRSMCLRVLEATTCQTRLKTFLRFHGLSIIWSWMVDVSCEVSDEAATLRTDIIDTLCILPITNKNVIEDSKVLSVVQRWAKPEEEEKPEADEKTETGKSVKAEEETEKDIVSTAEPSDPVSTVDDEKVCDVLKVPEAPAPDEASKEEKDKNSPDKLIQAAAKLLESWKDLKEIYRIPKRARPPSPGQDSNSRTSSPTPKQPKTEDGEQKFSRSHNASRDASLERWKDHSERHSETKFREGQTSPGSNTSSENRREPGRRRRRFSTDSEDGTVPWLSKAPRPSKMSREEHRRRFEKDVEKKELEKRKMEEMEADMACNAIVNSQNPYPVETVPPMLDQNMMDQSMMDQGMSMMAPGTTFTPGGVSGNLIQINPAQVMVDQYGQPVDMQPVMQQSMFDSQVALQQGFNFQQGVQGVYSQDVVTQQVYQDAYGYNTIDMQGGISMAAMNQQQQMVNASMGVVNATRVPMELQPQLPAVPQPQPAMSNVTILGTQNGQAIVMLSAEQLQKLTQGDAPSAAPSDEKEKKSTKNPEKPKEKEKAAQKNKSPEQLPPNWKTAKDPDGRVYYYHNITRETQWDPPKWKDGDVGKDGRTTPDDGQSKDKQDGITEEGRKSKDQFRLKMSQFVVQCLSSFRKPDRKVGRITSTEDFKHLARKLTHIIMQKELKQVQVLEDLDFNANVKHKTKEYVKKYMGKVGPVYRIKDDT